MSITPLDVAQRYLSPVAVDPATATFTDALAAFADLIRACAPSIREHPDGDILACVFLASTRDVFREALSQMPDNVARWNAIMERFLRMWDADVSRLPGLHR